MNSFSYCMMFFFFFIASAVLITIFAYRKCKNLGLSPPLPVLQAEQLHFYKYLSDKSKSTEYKSLRPWVNGLRLTFFMCALTLITALFLA